LWFDFLVTMPTVWQLFVRGRGFLFGRLAFDKNS